MAKYTKKPVTVDAVNFNELVADGILKGAPLTRGMPWSWELRPGIPVTHENDDAYLVSGTTFCRGDMLVIGPSGAVSVFTKSEFEAEFDPASEPAGPGV